MTANVTTQTPVDDRDIPSIDATSIPQVVEGDRDWRGELDQLRERHPYFRVTGNPTIWFTRWEAARDIFADGETFYDPNWTESWGTPEAVSTGSGWDIEQSTPAESLKAHLRVRQAVMYHYSPKYIRTWEPRMRETCRDLIGRFADRGECDFVNDFGKYYFPYLGAQWLGAPREDWDEFIEWEHEVFQLHPSAGDDRLLHMSGEAMGKILDYLEKLIDRKRREPDDSFTSYLLRQEIDGTPFSIEQIRGALTIAALGSGHTVTSALGYLFRHLALRPELQRAVVDDPSIVPTLGEEVIRLYSLFGHARVVARDLDDFHGVPLRRGDQVFVMYTMPNRDPRQPGFDSEDPRRKPNPHLAFNFGPRRCIGQHWARIARDVCLQEWHAAIPSYRLAPGVQLVEQIYAGTGYRSLPLVWP